MRARPAGSALPHWSRPAQSQESYEWPWIRLACSLSRKPLDSGGRGLALHTFAQQRGVDASPDKCALVDEQHPEFGDSHGRQSGHEEGLIGELIGIGHLHPPLDNRPQFFEQSLSLEGQTAQKHNVAFLSHL